MAGETLLLDAAFQAVTALVYIYVGRVTARRHVEGEGKLASSLFSVFWYTLGGITATGAATRVLAYVGVLDVGIHAAVAHLALLGLCVALWALLYYLVYLFTGDRRWFLPLTAFYAMYYVWIVYLVARARPNGVRMDDWSVQLTYANTLDPIVTAVFTILLIVPGILGAIGYARLFWRVEEPTQRYRIGMVAFTLLAWFGSSLGAYGLGISQATWWQLVSRAIGLVAALFIYAAYRPPRWVQRRWGIRPVDDPAPQ